MTSLQPTAIFVGAAVPAAVLRSRSDLAVLAWTRRCSAMQYSVKPIVSRCKFHASYNKLRRRRTMTRMPIQPSIAHQEQSRAEQQQHARYFRRANKYWSVRPFPAVGSKRYMVMTSSNACIFFVQPQIGLLCSDWRYLFYWSVFLYFSRRKNQRRPLPV